MFAMVLICIDIILCLFIFYGLKTLSEDKINIPGIMFISSIISILICLFIIYLFGYSYVIDSINLFASIFILGSIIMINWIIIFFIFEEEVL